MSCFSSLFFAQFPLWLKLNLFIYFEKQLNWIEIMQKYSEIDSFNRCEWEAKNNSNNNNSVANVTFFYRFVNADRKCLPSIDDIQWQE